MKIEIIHSVKNPDTNPLYCSLTWGEGILPAPSIANKDLCKIIQYFKGKSLNFYFQWL